MDYKSNSHKSKAEGATEKRVGKVVTGAAKTRKKKEIHKITDLIFAEDFGTVKEFLIYDVAIPGIKNLVLDILIDGATRTFGGSGSRRGGGARTSTDYVSYNRYSDRGSRRSERDSRPRAGFDYEDIIFESRGDAELARDTMDDMIDRYGVVTVADLYDMAEITPPYTANKYGWTNIRNAEPARLREGGYVLKLPKAMPID